nr:dicarboxylate/amino acid:cation symporter [Clostridium sp. Marseille-Q2269]
MESKRKKSLTFKILFSLFLGIIFGIIANSFFPQQINNTISKWVLVPMGNIFLRGIKMLVVPLVLFSIICGAASTGDIKKLGRVGGKIFTYYLITTAVAISIALFIANIFKPGMGIALKVSKEIVKTEKPQFIMDMLVNMIPSNPIEAMVKGDMLQIIFFALMVGISITLVGSKAKNLLNIFEEINVVLLKMINIIMKITPLGVFALISNVIMAQGIKVLIPLIKYLLVAVLILAIHTFLVYGGMLKFIGKLSPISFFKKFWPTMVFAFSTSSSNVTIPINLETCEKKFGVDKSISSFTIPLGATINMDGTAIMQGLAAIFVSQMYGINLSLNQQLTIILMATLASIGTSGVPGTGIVMLSMVFQQVGLPLEGIGIILSVDRIFDMARTAVNITGDAVGTLIVANSEKGLNKEIYEEFTA